MAERYLRPILRSDGMRPDNALTLAGGWLWFDQIEQRTRDGNHKVITPCALSDTERDSLCTPRANIDKLSFDRPLIMGILNVTPDSFSDGGDFEHSAKALHHAKVMHRDGAAIIDIGGESTRPGADYVDPELEQRRTVHLTRHIARDMPVSIDTRKASVARANLEAGAILFNDISALSHDGDSLSVLSETGANVCLMHSNGEPKTMQNNPQYDHVIFDIYDYLAERIAICERAGINRNRIIIDPGIGFGKTLAHNLTLIRNLALFHALGCPILFGASRKRLIAQLADAPAPKDRLPGSLALGLAAIAQGAQIIRVHDVAQTQQAIKLWQATQTEEIHA